MVSFLADENLNNRIIRYLHNRNSAIDIISVQDIGKSGCNDQELLEWVRSNRRILLTSDIRTIPPILVKMAESGETLPPVFFIPQNVKIATVVDDLVLVAEASDFDYWIGKVFYLPFQN